MMLIGPVQTSGGFVVGVPGNDPNVTIYKGIPYAAPPVGDLRWKAPQPVIPWEGIRKCDSFSSTSIQGDPDISGSPNPFAAFFQKEFYPERMPMSEDCLYLNIWKSSSAETAKLPVMVWIHGGGFGSGYGHEMEFDGEGFVKKGVILVTINYRTGILGFLAHPELSAESEHGVSGNYGILDQIAALQWVKANIEAFGGDSDNITIFGQSAGAMSVEVLSCSPLTKGLVNKAIMMSGGGLKTIDNAMPLCDAEKIGVEVCSLLGAKSIEELRKRPAEEVHYGVFGFKPQTVAAGMLFFTPNTDGYVLEQDNSDVILQGKHHEIPYMLGFTQGETGWFKNMIPGVTGFARNQIKLGRPASFVYCFDRDLPGDDMGSFHSCELWYVFETMGRCWRPFEKADYDISALMSTYWANFAKTGDPNGDDLLQWSRYTEESPLAMRFCDESGMSRIMG